MKYLFFLPLFLFICLIFAFPVFAHILETDRAISAVMHIDPDDTPTAGSQSALEFEIQDKTGKFSLVNCNCTVSIQEEGKVIYSHTITKQPLPYSFAKPDTYTIILAGFPKTMDAFQRFRLVYTATVEKQPSFFTQIINFFGRHIFHLLLGVGILAVCSILLIGKLYITFIGR